MKKTRFFFTALFCLFFSGAALASGGLDSATTALEDLKSWLFPTVGIVALIYMMYCMVMAFMEKKSWGEVGQALVYCCLAGGAVVGGTWALEMFQ